MNQQRWIFPELWLVRIMYIMLNNLHGSITSWFTRAATEISMLWILRYLPFIALGLSYIYFTSCWLLGVSMYSLTQIVSSNGRRHWILMDVKICLPALYPLRYLVDHQEYRSLSTQSASLQAILPLLYLNDSFLGWVSTSGLSTNRSVIQTPET